MRRWSWLLGLLVIAVLGAVWWTSRNALDKWVRYAALKKVAYTYVQHGDEHRALELAQSISDFGYQRDVLMAILRNRVERRNPFWKGFIRTL